MKHGQGSTLKEFIVANGQIDGKVLDNSGDDDDSDTDTDIQDDKNPRGGDWDF